MVRVVRVAYDGTTAVVRPQRQYGTEYLIFVGAESKGIAPRHDHKYTAEAIHARGAGEAVSQRA
jgi:hypothetical protein